MLRTYIVLFVACLLSLFATPTYGQSKNNALKTAKAAPLPIQCAVLKQGKGMQFLHLHYLNNNRKQTITFRRKSRGQRGESGRWVKNRGVGNFYTSYQWNTKLRFQRMSPLFGRVSMTKTSIRTSINRQNPKAGSSRTKIERFRGIYVPIEIGPARAYVIFFVQGNTEVKLTQGKKANSAKKGSSTKKGYGKPDKKIPPKK